VTGSATPQPAFGRTAGAIERFPEKHARGSIGGRIRFSVRKCGLAYKEHFQERPAPEAMRAPPLAATAR
jgi:hypothetical protein